MILFGPLPAGRWVCLGLTVVYLYPNRNAGALRVWRWTAAAIVVATGEALETAPGLIVAQHSGEGKAGQYFLRGFNLDHGTDLAITIDGMPANMRTHENGQGYADINFLIPELVQSVRASLR